MIDMNIFWNGTALSSHKTNIRAKEEASDSIMKTITRLAFAIAFAAALLAQAADAARELSVEDECIAEKEALAKCVSEKGSKDCSSCSRRALSENDGVYPENDLGAALRCDGLRKSDMCGELLDCAREECPDGCLMELHDHHECLVRMTTGCELGCSTGFKGGMIAPALALLGAAAVGWVQI